MQLYPYQQDDVARMHHILSDHHAVFLLNEQRTGKLVEFIALCQRIQPSSVLVVAPLSTLWNVQDEFARWAGWPVRVNNASYVAGDVFVQAVNTERLRRADSVLLRRQWDIVLLDEAHHFRGRRSAQTKGAFKLRACTERLVISTGTPLMNGLPREIWPLLHLADPQRWSSFWRFLQEHAAQMHSPAGAWQDDHALWRRGAMAQVKRWMAPMTLRRMYMECYPALPPTTRQTIRLHLQALDVAQWQAYQQLEQEWRTYITGAEVVAPTALALTLRLRQLAASPVNVGAAALGGKGQAIVEFVATHDGPLVIFCWHRAFAHALAQHCPSSLVVTGADAPPRRVQLVRDWQAGQARVLVATISALSEGQDLSRAGLLLFAERSWVPDENEQAAARVLGPKRTRPAHIVNFVCTDTIEHDIERVLSQKAAVTSHFMAFQALIALHRPQPVC